MLGTLSLLKCVDGAVSAHGSLHFPCGKNIPDGTVPFWRTIGELRRSVVCCCASKMRKFCSRWTFGPWNKSHPASQRRSNWIPWRTENQGDCEEAFSVHWLSYYTLCTYFAQNTKHYHLNLSFWSFKKAVDDRCYVDVALVFNSYVSNFFFQDAEKSYFGR